MKDNQNEIFYKKERENGIIQYHCHKKDEDNIERYIRDNEDIFQKWDKKHIVKDIIIYEIKKEEDVKPLKQFIKNYHNDLEKKYKIEKLEKEKDLEKICRTIMIELYNITKKIKNPSYDILPKYFFSFNNINTILIKIDSKNQNLSIKLNLFEMFLSQNISYFSGTKISQAPQKRNFINMLKDNGTYLKIFGNIAQFILICKFEKINIHPISIIASHECKTFLRTCFLNLIVFDDLINLDFFTKSFDSFKFPKPEDLSINSNSYSYLIDYKPKKKNFTEVSFSDEGKYQVLELNSFCVKPENEEEKIDIKKKFQEVEKRQNEKKNIPDLQNSNDEMDSFFLYNPYFKDYDNCKIEELFNIFLEKREKSKQEQIEMNLEKIPIYTYPVPKEKVTEIEELSK